MKNVIIFVVGVGVVKYSYKLGKIVGAYKCAKVTYDLLEQNNINPLLLKI